MCRPRSMRHRAGRVLLAGGMVLLGAVALLATACASGDDRASDSTRAGAGRAAPAPVAKPAAAASADPPPARPIRGQLGPDSPKIKRTGDQTLVWAGPRPASPKDPKAKWYDFTGAPMPAEELQFGIGIDSIPAIDDPLFVKPDDPRLLQLGRNPYDRREQAPKTLDDIPVIGFAVGDDARAYPVRVLDRHELVNDKVGGKPVTVGW